MDANLYLLLNNNHKDKKSKHYKSDDEINTKFIKSKNFYDFDIESDLFLIGDLELNSVVSQKRKCFNSGFKQTMLINPEFLN